MCSILSVGSTDNHGLYLGLPSIMGKNKSGILSFVKEKGWKRLQGWRNKLLSRAGKEVLLKSVVQSILSHVMQVFALLLIVAL